MKGAIVVMPGEGDGFLKKVLPASGIKAELDLDVVWSTKTGFQFKGGIGLEVEIPVNLSIADVIKLQSVFVRVYAGAVGLEAVVAISATIKIGPVSGAIERVGAKGALAIVEDHQGNLGPFEPSLGFKPPSGAGMSIKAGPVTGGGYLFFDPDDEQYAGHPPALVPGDQHHRDRAADDAAAGPAGGAGATKKGFSLLVIIAVEFPPIQLGYGFTLNGVGGLLGINRTMMVDALRDGVRNGTRRTRSCSRRTRSRARRRSSASCAAIFPPAEGRFVFGPMVKIGWGPNAIIELAARGRPRADVADPARDPRPDPVALPDKKDPVLNLRLDIVGVARLRQGRGVGRRLAGRLAPRRVRDHRRHGGARRLGRLEDLRARRRRLPPAVPAAAGLPALRRLAIALADSDNPRLRLETYFALTANTIQFGAGLDLYAKADTFVGSFSVGREHRLRRADPVPAVRLSPSSAPRSTSLLNGDAAAARGASRDASAGRRRGTRSATRSSTSSASTGSTSRRRSATPAQPPIVTDRRPTCSDRGRRRRSPAPTRGRRCRRPTADRVVTLRDQRARRRASVSTRSAR